MKIKLLNRNNDILDERLINYHKNKVLENEVDKQDIIDFIKECKYELRQDDKIVIELN